jgi:hypothetical protein
VDKGRTVGKLTEASVVRSKSLNLSAPGNVGFTTGLPHAVGHEPSFALSSKISPRSADDRQVSGNESELHLVSTRPFAVAYGGQVYGQLLNKAAIEQPATA